MKKNFLLIFGLFLNLISSAQNVGIGETNPTASKLQVMALDSSVVILHNNTISGSNIKTGLYFKTGNYYSGYVATIGSSYAHRMGFFTYGGVAPSILRERLSISDAGSVGIGTTQPNYLLEVKSDPYVNATFELNASEGNSAILGINRKSISYASVINFKTANALQWYIGSNVTNEFRIIHAPTSKIALSVDNLTSNIGIGTNDYSSKLNVDGAVAAKGNFISNGTNSGYKFLDRTANAYGGWIWYADAGKANLFRYGGLGDAVTIDATGKMGVGVSNPGARLDVNGRLRLRREGTYGSGIWLDGPTETQQSFIGMEDDDNISFFSYSGGWKHHFNAKTGVVRIGTLQSSAGYMLNVGGKVIAEEVRVQLKAAWPDYVFAKNYSLRPLEEVEQFIKENNHLPNIPSAADIQKNGQMLGEVQSKLLEKIEELTLYIIELKKQSDKQQQEINILKNANK